VSDALKQTQTVLCMGVTQNCTACLLVGNVHVPTLQQLFQKTTCCLCTTLVQRMGTSNTRTMCTIGKL